MKLLLNKWFYLLLFPLLFFLISAHIPAYAQTPTPVTCDKEIPADAPNLYQISKSSASATLYFVEPVSQFDGYTISYGLTSSADTYNTTFSGSRTGAATSRTINDLTPETTYYFKVRANNGCATGPYSPVLSSLSILPATGPSSSILGLGIGGIFLVLAGFALFFLL